MPKYTGYGKRKRPASMGSKTKKKRKIASKKKTSKTNQGQIAILKKKVRSLNTRVEALNGEMIYRAMGYTLIESAQNNCSLFQNYVGDKAFVQDSLAELRYYDPQNPSALVNTTFLAGAYSKTITIMSMGLKIRMKANYRVGFRYEAWLVKPRVAGADNAGTDWATWSQDAVYGQANAEINPNCYPTDIRALMLAWNFKLLKRGEIQPGKSLSLSYYDNKPWTFNDSYIEDAALEFQRNLHCAGILVRLTGPIAHDTTTSSLLGRSRIAAVCECTAHIKMKYDAGADIKYVVINDTPSTFTDSLSDRVGYYNNPQIGTVTVGT